MDRSSLSTDETLVQPESHDDEEDKMQENIIAKLAGVVVMSNDSAA